MRTLRLFSRLIMLAALLAGTTREPLAQEQPRRQIAPEIRRHRDLARRAYSGERARDVVAYMEQWFRVPGNTGFDSSLTNIVRLLRGAGFVEEGQATASQRLVYRIESRPLRHPAWDPIDAELTIVGQRAPLLRWSSNRNMLAINSYSTPDTGTVAELVDAGSGSSEFDTLDVEGKIVLTSTSAPLAFHEAVRKRKALGVLAYGMPAYTQPEKNRTSIQFETVERDTLRQAWAIALSRGAYDALRAALRHGPVFVRVRSRTRFFPSSDRTVVAEVRGGTRPAERFVLSAHVQEPGANDNASGVGTLVEMARFFASEVRRGQINPRRTITMLFGTEIAQTRNFLADSTRRASVIWGMSLDMTGQDVEKTGGTFLIEKMPDPSAIWTRGEERHSEWGAGRPLTPDRLKPHYFNDLVLDRCLDQADGTRWIVRTNPYEGGSDHVPFLDADKPAVLLWHFTDQFYHTDNDRLDKVSASEQKNVGICALVTALTLATGTPATTQALVRQVARNALDRIQTELALSKTAIKAGRPIATERTILETWISWYRDAIRRMSEIEVGGPSPGTALLIEDQAGAFERKARERLKELK